MLCAAAGYLGQYTDRTWVLALGCWIWSAMTFTFSYQNSVSVGTGLWAVVGLGLSFMQPAIESMMADLFAVKNLGKAFGSLQVRS